MLRLDEPTAGVDVGAKADIHDQVRALAAAITGQIPSTRSREEAVALVQ